MAAGVSSQPVRTYTVSFPGQGAFDESPFARMVATHFGTQHTELVAEAASVDLLPRLARQYDEPIADSSMIPTFLVSELVRKNCTVALGGDGGDELFGGYSLYNIVLAQQALRGKMPHLARRVVSSLGARLRSASGDGPIWRGWTPRRSRRLVAPASTSMGRPGER